MLGYDLSYATGYFATNLLLDQTNFNVTFALTQVKKDLLVKNVVKDLLVQIICRNI